MLSSVGSDRSDVHVLDFHGLSSVRTDGVADFPHIEARRAAGAILLLVQGIPNGGPHTQGSEVGGQGFAIDGRAGGVQGA